MRSLSCGISKNQVFTREWRLKSDPFRSFVHEIDRKSLNSGRLLSPYVLPLEGKKNSLRRQISTRTTRFTFGEVGWEDSTGGIFSRPVLFTFIPAASRTAQLILRKKKMFFEKNIRHNQSLKFYKE